MHVPSLNKWLKVKDSFNFVLFDLNGVSGLLYLHGLGYVHRDIKPEYVHLCQPSTRNSSHLAIHRNILLGMNGRVLIADLG